LIERTAARFGSQCVVISIDVRRHSSGQCTVCVAAGTEDTGIDPVVWAREAAERGAGEILLTSIERDGTMTGYDIPLIEQVVAAVDIPVIASGGAGNPAHMVEAVKVGGASAIAAASIFHFTEQTPGGVKQALREAGVPVRQSFVPV
jgi:cyclase